MERYQVFTIGRREDNDIVMTHASVSRSHAEILVAPDGSAMLSDCCSTSGTHLKRGGQWREISHNSLQASDHLRFGKFDVSARRLISAARDLIAQNAAISERPVVKRNQTQSPGDGLPRRDVNSGQIVMS